jgi:hypothetical protein
VNSILPNIFVKIKSCGPAGSLNSVNKVTNVFSFPSLVVHADWGSSPQKRWVAHAFREPDGRCSAGAAEKAGNPKELLKRLRERAGRDACILIGFDFPIGIPLRYAEIAGISDYITFLHQLSANEWPQFFKVAESPDEISVFRPFYPGKCNKKGQVRFTHMTEKLGTSRDGLLRSCERGCGSRRAASPLFWTIGAQQAGKAAICGWKDVIIPAISAKSGDEIKIWPFSGPLPEILGPGHTVIAETYPAEFYNHLGFRFGRKKGLKSGKRVQADRIQNAKPMLEWTKRNRMTLSPALRQEIENGFGSLNSGEDRFDAVAGLLGMLDALFRYRPSDEPADERLRKIEGWIFGRSVPDADLFPCYTTKDPGN